MDTDIYRSLPTLRLDERELADLTATMQALAGCPDGDQGEEYFGPITEIRVSSTHDDKYGESEIKGHSAGLFATAPIPFRVGSVRILRPGAEDRPTCDVWIDSKYGSRIYVHGKERETVLRTCAALDRELLKHKVGTQWPERVANSWLATVLPIVLLGMVASPLIDRLPGWLRGMVGDPVTRWVLWIGTLVAVALALAALSSWLTPDSLKLALNPPFPQAEFAGRFSAGSASGRTRLLWIVRRVVAPVTGVGLLLVLFVLLASKP